MNIVIDTREQRPWSFPPDVNIRFGTLRTGDYALEGDNTLAIERKSADDFVGTISTGWHRFVKELNRMEQFRRRIIIVESDFETFCFKTRQGMILPPDHEHNMLSPQFIMKRLAELTMNYNANVIFAGNPEYASNIAFRILLEQEKFLNNKER